MRLGEVTAKNLNFDYWFLRDNHVAGKTVLRMVALAYMGEKK